MIFAHLPFWQFAAAICHFGRLAGYAHLANLPDWQVRFHVPANPQ
jgi:hypothetical protein